MKNIKILSNCPTGKPSLVKAKNPAHGFTLTELVMSIAIMGIILAFGLPSLQAMLVSNRLTAQVNDMVGALNIARSEAAKRNQLVAVSKTGNNWEGGWQVFVDSNASNSFDKGEEIVQQYGQLDAGYAIKPKDTNNISIDSIDYRPDGRSNVFGSFFFCSPAAQTTLREIEVVNSGRIRTVTPPTATYKGAC